jgi:hypothetical protein
MSAPVFRRPPSTFVASLVPVWRILAAVAALQLLGSGVALLIGFHYSAFMNFWLGGCLATPLGFFVGLLWHLSEPQRRRGTRVEVVVFLGVIAVGLGAAALVGSLPEMAKEMTSLGALQTLPDGAIERISVYDRYGETLLLQIDDKTALSGFVLACRNAKGYLPNHPVYAESWYLVLQGEQRVELECHYQQGDPDEVVGYFVRKTRNSTSYFGTFISRDLRPWFQQHIEGRHP